MLLSDPGYTSSSYFFPFREDIPGRYGCGFVMLLFLRDGEFCGYYLTPFLPACAPTSFCTWEEFIAHVEKLINDVELREARGIENKCYKNWFYDGLKRPVSKVIYLIQSEYGGWSGAVFDPAYNTERRFYCKGQFKQILIF